MVIIIYNVHTKYIQSILYNGNIYIYIYIYIYIIYTIVNTIITMVISGTIGTLPVPIQLSWKQMFVLTA